MNRLSASGKHWYFLALVAVCAVMVGSGAALAEGPAVKPGTEVTILALGDSLTAGYGLAQDAAYPVKLEAALEAKGHAVRIINAGVSGDTTAGGLARLGWALADKPDAAIVALGGNDGLRGIDPRSSRDNMTAIVKTLSDQGIPVLIAGMLAPPNLGAEYGAVFNAIFPEVAEQYGMLLYPFFLEGVALDPDLNQPDGIHPTAAGVDVMVAGTLPLVEQLIGLAHGHGATDTP